LFPMDAEKVQRKSDSTSLRHPQTAVVEPTFRRSERSSMQTVMVENLNTVGVNSEQQLLSLNSFVDAQCTKAETVEGVVFSECSSSPANFKDFSSDSVFSNELASFSTPSGQRVSTCTPATVVRRRSPQLDIMKNGVALENLFNVIVGDKSASEMEDEYSSMKERLIDEINKQAIEIQKLQDDIAHWKEQNELKKKIRDEIQWCLITFHLIINLILLFIHSFTHSFIVALLKIMKTGLLKLPVKETNFITKNMEYFRVLDDRNQILEDLISAENVISELQKRYEKFCLSYKNCLDNDAKLKACLEEGRKNFLQSTNRMMQLKQHVKELMKTVMENKDEAVVSQREDLVALTAEVKKNELAVQTLKEDCDQMDKQIQELSEMVFLSCAKQFPRRFLNSPHPVDFSLPKRTRWFKRQRVFRFTGWYYADARDKYSPALNHLQHAWQKMTERRKDLPAMRNWYYEKRVQAAANEHGVSYEQLKESLNKANIRLNTKMLSLLGSNEPRSFKSLMDVCKAISQESAKVPTNTSSAL
ncbi:50S ribosomal protein L20, partial [Trichinella pseudospiralis]